MYDDTVNKRVLLRNGISLVDDMIFAEKLINGKITDSTKILAGDDSDTYKLLFGTDIGYSGDGEVEPKPSDHEHTQEDIDLLIDTIESSDRFENTDEFVDRIHRELKYFIGTKNVVFLLKIVDMIKKFKQDGVVWGVGRGSSCSSLILYVIEAHDINPLRFNIPFSELSKEQESKFGDKDD